MKCSGGGGKAVCGALSTAGVIAAVVRHVLVVLGARLLLVEPFVASAPLAKRMAARHCCVRLQRHAPAQNAQKPWQARAQQLEPELLIVLALLLHHFFFVFWVLPFFPFLATTLVFPTVTSVGVATVFSRVQLGVILACTEANNKPNKPKSESERGE